MTAACDCSAAVCIFGNPILPINSAFDQIFDRVCRNRVSSLQGAVPEREQ
jgi:hypothetical protein